ncbi:hypothetical protein P3X46_030194 [Hevea brasiliensis]|uniref:30S ribosomal protein S6 alpha, chloroplastic n=1 Tax=Hevea brasiliensis TaxID=3981 RepID=A0ABQ9KV17_HEVBR|nr:hypothetical protein P3X46_030194 [Hevea brasiliensis]
MASSSSFSLVYTLINSSPFCPKSLSKYLPFLAFAHALKPFPGSSSKTLLQKRQYCLTVKAQTLDFSGSFYEGGGFRMTAVEDKEQPQCPPGLGQYGTTAVLRPDMSENEQIALTLKYEELLVAGGGMYIEVFNRGVIPLAYSIYKKNKAGETNTYLDGIYLLFTYFTKPESIAILEATLKTDDDVIRSTSFKVRKRKL